MRYIDRNTKRLDKIEIVDITLDDGKSIRILRDKQTDHIQLILDFTLLAVQNQNDDSVPHYRRTRKDRNAVHQIAE